MDKVWNSVEKMRFLQQSIRTSNVKDYIVQRSNSFRVTTFSGKLYLITAGLAMLLSNAVTQLEISCS